MNMSILLLTKCVQNWYPCCHQDLPSSSCSGAEVTQEVNMKDHEFQINLLTSSLPKPDLENSIPSQTKWCKIPMCGTFVVKFWFYFKSGVCAYGHISTYWITAGQGGMHLCLPCWNLSHISMVDMLVNAYLSDASKVWSNRKNIAHHAVRNVIFRHALLSRAQCSHTLYPHFVLCRLFICAYKMAKHDLRHHTSKAPLRIHELNSIELEQQIVGQKGAENLLGTQILCYIIQQWRMVRYRHENDTTTNNR